MKSKILWLLSILLFTFSKALVAAEPNACVKGEFSSTGDQYWRNITLKITNTCNTDVDLQDAIITFQNKSDLETTFWGQFDPLAYPDHENEITSEPDGSAFLSTLRLHFPSYGSGSKLPKGQSIFIQYGASSDDFVQGSVKVYTGGVVATGSIILSNASPKPLNVSQTYALVHVMMNGQKVTDIQLPWRGNKTVDGLAPATYTLSADNVSDSSGNVYQSTINPMTITLAANQQVQATVSYAKIQATGKLAVQLQALPTELSGYTGKPIVMVKDGSSSISVNLNWNSTTTVSQLTNGTSYSFSTPSIIYNGMQWNPVFQPTTLVAKSTTLPLTSLTYQKAQSTGSPVAVNGQLKVIGTNLCNEQNQPIQLRGMSSHGLQWYGNCLTAASLDALVNDFKASVLRLSLYVQEGGYETNPSGFTNQVNQLIKEASDRGIYAIVDWHILNPGDPNYNLERAKTFFTNIANTNKGRKNLIYEIANEPNGVNWQTIKRYADQLIPMIRSIDPNTVIVVGTPGWSSLGVSDGRNSQDIVNAPLNYPNVMYTFHFYAASHRDEYLNELDRASNVLPIFVTEFGTQTYSGDGANDFVMSDRYMELMARKKISWTNWNYSSDPLSGAIWKPGTCPNGPWTDANLKPSGVYIKSKIRG